VFDSVTTTIAGQKIAVTTDFLSNQAGGAMTVCGRGQTGRRTSARARLQRFTLNNIPAGAIGGAISGGVPAEISLAIPRNIRRDIRSIRMNGLTGPAGRLCVHGAGGRLA
jgi:hypothetical protein